MGRWRSRVDWCWKRPSFGSAFWFNNWRSRWGCVLVISSATYVPLQSDVSTNPNEPNPIGRRDYGINYFRLATRDRRCACIKTLFVRLITVLAHGMPVFTEDDNIEVAPRFMQLGRLIDSPGWPTCLLTCPFVMYSNPRRLIAFKIV